MIHRPMALVLLLVLFGGCGPESITFPSLPSLEATADHFEHPTGTVPVEQISDRLAEGEDRLLALEGSRVADLVADGLEALRRRLEANELGVAPDTPPPDDKVAVDAYLLIHRICQGWNDASVSPDPANGTFELVGVVRHSRLERAMAMTASACKARVPVGDGPIAHIYLDGKLGLYLDQSVPRTTGETHFVGLLDGTIGNEARRWPVSIAFRVIHPRLEVAIPGEGGEGEIVVTRNADGLELRGSNGTFTCSLETATCQ
jgi:hypothetical protein